MVEIGIIGSGSLGLLYSFYLSINNKVTLYTNRNEQSVVINDKGLTLVKGNSKYDRVIHATSDKKYIESILIITVKQYQLYPIIERLKRLSPRTIIFLQNGMAHLKYLPNLSHHQIILGVSEHGALRVDDCTVHHTGIGVTKISSYDKNEPELIAQLNKNEPSFPFIRTFNWEKMLKEKLIVNATINPLTALFNVKNGELLTNPFFHKLFYELFEEVSSILKLEDKDGLWKHVTKLCENTAANMSSMCKDIQNNKQTEIDSILGYIIEIANGESIPRISFLNDAIKGIEETKGGAHECHF